MSNPFEYVNSINDHKNIMVDTENDELAEKGYNPYMVNRQFSYFIDTVYAANAMNQYHELDNKLQYDFLINIVRPRKRFSKWAKPDEHNDFDVIQEYYGYSNEKTKVAMDILSGEQIAKLKDGLHKGGVKK